MANPKSLFVILAVSVLILILFLLPQTVRALPDMTSVDCSSSLVPGSPFVTCEREAKQVADECFCGVGDLENGPPGNNCAQRFSFGTAIDPITMLATPDPELPLCTGNQLLSFTCRGLFSNPSSRGAPCCSFEPIADLQTQCIPKINDAYAWGLNITPIPVTPEPTGPTVWEGTVANGSCQTQGPNNFVRGAPTPPSVGNDDVCEFGFGPPLYSPAETVPFLGDQRTPHIYTYNTQSGVLNERFVNNCGGIDQTALLASSVGLRSVGILGDIVFLAGPALPILQPDDSYQLGGINMFAFQASNGNCLGGMNFGQWTDVRKWVALNNVLYVAVGNKSALPNKVFAGGSVLRWRGNLANPFVFEVVGNLDGIGSNIASHAGKIYVTTWPNLTGDGALDNLPNIIDTGDSPIPLSSLSSLAPAAGLFMSPTVPSGGLTASHATKWKKVWRASNYEPDLLIALTYGGGDLASYGGWLYWGTMHVANTAFNYFTAVYPPNPPLVSRSQAEFDVKKKTYRSNAIFRGKNFGSSTQQIQLLYGEASLPVFTPNQDPATGGTWAPRSNNMFSSPLYGPSGFGNMSNGYTWIMRVVGTNSQLCVGTLEIDSTSVTPCCPPNLCGTRAPNICDLNLCPGTLSCPCPSCPASCLEANASCLPQAERGGDLYCFPNATSPAVAVNLDGFGNENNGGNRTMAVSGNVLYVGTANNSNLDSTPVDPITGKGTAGGWELIRLELQPPPPPVCGNAICESGENCSTCLVDCPKGFLRCCGDGKCSSSTERSVCPIDCP